MTLRTLFVLLAALVACGGGDQPRRPSVLLTNGFDFPVTVTIAPATGATVRVDVPARGRVPASVRGKATVTVTTTAGAAVHEGPAQFAATHRGCVTVYNVLGSAAVESRDITFGDGSVDPSRLLGAGQITNQYCGLSWIFESPPAAITVKSAGPASERRGWLGYIGDGGWQTSVKILLATPEDVYAGQYRNPASQILAAVRKHDSTNPDLPALLDVYRSTAPPPKR